MLASLDNAFVIERMFGSDAKIFDNAILSELHLNFGSNSPVSPHWQSIYFALEFQTFCQVIHPPKRWVHEQWDSVYIYITISSVDHIDINLRKASMGENPLKVVSHKTKALREADGFTIYATEFIFEQNYWLKFEHTMGHIQHMSNHKKYVE